MSIPEHRFSTIFVDGVYIPPEERDRVTLLEDYEGGPLAILDTSEGMNYQVWKLEYIDPNFTLTPETSGSPTLALTAAGAEQVSFCFDQNARPSLCYIVGSSAFLYWYDTQAGDFVTTEYTGVTSCMLSLDDKRDLQVGANDMIFWYTKEISPDVYHCFTREQRERFETEYVMQVDGVTQEVYPYLYKAGMHQGLRGKVALIDNKPI